MTIQTNAYHTTLSDQILRAHLQQVVDLVEEHAQDEQMETIGRLVGGYAVREGKCGVLATIIHRIVNFFKSLCGISDWQQANRLLGSIVEAALEQNNLQHIDRAKDGIRQNLSQLTDCMLQAYLAEMNNPTLDPIE